MEILWPVVAGGAFAVLFGVALIRWRAQLARFFAEAHKEVFNDRTASIRRATTPPIFVPLGIAGIGIGLVGIAVAIFAPDAF